MEEQEVYYILGEGANWTVALEKNSALQGTIPLPCMEPAGTLASRAETRERQLTAAWMEQGKLEMM